MKIITETEHTYRMRHQQFYPNFWQLASHGRFYMADHALLCLLLSISFCNYYEMLPPSHPRMIHTSVFVLSHLWPANASLAAIENYQIRLRPRYTPNNHPSYIT